MQSEEDYPLKKDMGNIVWYNNQRPLLWRILYSLIPPVIAVFGTIWLLHISGDLPIIGPYHISWILTAFLLGFSLMFLYFSDKTPRASRPWRVGISENGITLEFWRSYSEFYPWEGMKLVGLPLGMMDLQTKNLSFVGISRLSKDVRARVLKEFHRHNRSQ